MIGREGLTAGFHQRDVIVGKTVYADRRIAHQAARSRQSVVVSLEGGTAAVAAVDVDFNIPEPVECQCQYISTFSCCS